MRLIRSFTKEACVHVSWAGRYAVRLRYPSPSTCGAAGRHAGHLPDGMLGDDTAWARGFVPLRTREGLCARMCGAPLKRWLLFPRASAQPVF